VEQHVKILGVLNIVWGAMGALGGLVLLAIFGGAFGIAGAAIGHNPGAHIALPIIAIIGSVFALLLLILSIPSIVAGIGLLCFKPWARILALVISVLHLFNIPIGTALGIYGLWVLLSREGQRCFSPDRAAPAVA
jgi:hypothetical protein